jgi:hypothetical protein
MIRPGLWARFGVTEDVVAEAAGGWGGGWPGREDQVYSAAEAGPG